MRDGVLKRVLPRVAKGVASNSLIFIAHLFQSQRLSMLDMADKDKFLLSLVSFITCCVIFALRLWGQISFDALVK